MNTIDLILLIPLLLGLFNGYKKGLFSQIAGIVALLILFVFGSFFAGIIQNFLIVNHLVAENWVQAVSYILTGVLIFLLLGITAQILRKIISTVGLGFFERLGGALIGLLKVFLIYILVYYFFEPVNQKFNMIPIKTINGSLIIDYVEMGKNAVQDFKI